MTSLPPHVRRRPESSQDHLVKNWLRERSSIFRECDDLSEKIWRDPSAEESYKFKRARLIEDTQTGNQENIYHVYREVLTELDDGHSFRELARHGGLEVLDICMAPGGFAKVILERYEGSRVSGISLPVDKGGHCLIANLFDGLEGRFEVQYIDITMLATEFGADPVALGTHPECSQFLTMRPYHGTKFNLVMADGAVLEDHKRDEYRTKHIEAPRLRVSETILALQRIKSGGTYVMLLHHIHAWETASLLRDFSTFSDVHVKKPTGSHRASSSFYLIAENVQPDRASALINKCKGIWRDVTLKPHHMSDVKVELDSPSRQLLGDLSQLHVHEHDEITSKRLAITNTLSGSTTDVEVFELLDSFGEKLIEMGEPVWQTQTRGLKAKAGRNTNTIDIFQLEKSRRSTNESIWGPGRRQPNASEHTLRSDNLRRGSLASSSSEHDNTYAMEQGARDSKTRMGIWRPTRREQDAELPTEQRKGSFGNGRKQTERLQSITSMKNWRSQPAKGEDDADVAGLVQRAGNARPTK